MAPPKRSKVVTAKEVESGRISIPASVRDHLLPGVAQNTHTALTMIDENGDSHDVVIKVRENRTKPEIMSKGGKKFVRKRKLAAGATLDFSRADPPGQFKVTVRNGPQLRDLSATLQPLTMELELGFSIDLNQPPPSPPELSLSVGSNQVMLQRPAIAVARIKAEAQEVISPYDLRLSLGSTFLCDHPRFEKKIVERELKLKPEDLGHYLNLAAHDLH